MVSLKTKHTSQGGFSLIELLITLAGMTIICGAAFALIGSSIKFTNSTYHLTDAEEGLRTAHEIIHRDLTTAGDGMRGLSMIQVPKNFVQNYLTKTPIFDTSPDYVNLGLVTSDDNVPASTAIPQASPAANVLTGTDRLTMLTQDTSFTPISLLGGKITVVGSDTMLQLTSTDIGRFTVGEIYGITGAGNVAFGVVSGINTTTFVVTMTNGDTYGINQTGTGTPINVVSQAGTQPTSIVRMQIIQYYVNSGNLLMRRVFGIKGAGFVDSVIAEHVTNLQFRYLMNLSDPNGFVRQPIAQLTNSTEQSAVREVETTISVETAAAVNQVTQSNNGRQTISSVTATTVRNLQFRRAL